MWYMRHPLVKDTVDGLVKLRKEINMLANRRKVEQVGMEKNPNGATPSQVKALTDEFRQDLVKFSEWRTWLEESKIELEKLRSESFPYPSLQWDVSLVLSVIQHYLKGITFLENDRIQTLGVFKEWMNGHDSSR